MGVAVSHRGSGPPSRLTVKAGAERAVTIPCQDGHVERKQVSVYLDAEDLAALKEIAACQGMALSDVIRTVIHQAATRAQQWDDPLDYNPPRRGDR